MYKNIRPVYGLMVCTTCLWIPEIIPFPRTKVVKTMAFAVVEYFSPITVAGAALDLPTDLHPAAHQFPDYPVSTNTSKNRHLILKIQYFVAYYTINDVKIAPPIWE